MFQLLCKVRWSQAPQASFKRSTFSFFVQIRWKYVIKDHSRVYSSSKARSCTSFTRDGGASYSRADVPFVLGCHRKRSFSEPWILKHYTGERQPTHFIGATLQITSPFRIVGHPDIIVFYTSKSNSHRVRHFPNVIHCLPCRAKGRKNRLLQAEQNNPLPFLTALLRHTLLRGTIVNRAYGIHKKRIHLTIFTNNIWPY